MTEFALVSSPAHQIHRPLRAWSAVLLLTGVGVLNYADRFLPAILAEPIKAELHLSDTAIGVINGFGFLIVYAVVGIPIARISDKGAFGLVIAGCLTLWGAMTMLGGVVQSGYQLAATRVGVAIGEAGSNPAAHAYVARNFAPERRAAPLAVTTLAIPISSAAGLLAGGMLAEYLGWRAAFAILGGLSVAAAPLLLAVLGPRQAMPPTPAPARAVVIKWWELLRIPNYVAIVAGVACISIAGYSLSTFAPAYLMRVRDMSLSEVGVQYGIASGAIGVLGLLVVGRLADILSNKDRRWLLWLVIAIIAVALPFSILAFIVTQAGLAVFFIAMSYIVGAAYMAPSVAAIQLLVPTELRATASAIFLSAAAIIGASGPFVTGLISDTLRDDIGVASLGRALIIVPVAQVLAGICFALAAKGFNEKVIDNGPVLLEP
ncbi:spinster family MFS transporter [Mycolicibacterium vinylchloridicum]|uniref:spinster family MFS transporter n=1 Tax=Mycolicibacterium vinylchloridicum TaxID=2736928 RepID=UPI0015CCB6C5|nr:MFS transporter [Mycolicibacterium vinylchloridicum]